MISSLLLPLLITSVHCGLFPSLDVVSNGNINLRIGQTGQYSQLTGTGRDYEVMRMSQGESTYPSSNNYVSNVPILPSSLSSYETASYNEPASSYFPPSSSRPVALIINNYPPTKVEEVKAINEMDSHYSRPIKYRPPPNRIAHHENWYDTLVHKPQPTTLPPLSQSTSPVYVPPLPYQPDMSKYRWTANLASKADTTSESSYYAAPHVTNPINYTRP